MMAPGKGSILRRVLLWVASGAVIGGTVWLVADRFNEQRAERRMDALVTEIIALMDLNSTPQFHQRLDKVRTFVNDHSVHKIDQAFRANQGKPELFAAGLLAHAKGTGKPIHMECASRTTLMARILQALGYETRVVAIFDSHTNLKSHSFLDVLNPKTGQWETQDADYDIYWQKHASGERISLAEAAEAIGEIEPCGRLACGWANQSREGIKAEKLKPYLDLISITLKSKAVRYALYTSRADLNRTYSKGKKRGTFCEVEAKRCNMGFYDITKYSTYAPGLPR